jgi:hypothetical protein
VIVPKPKTVKNPKWLATVRQMPCHFRLLGNCNTYATIGKGPSEVSHLDGKSRDDRCLPCCGGHHRTNNTSWHNGYRSFCRFYGVTKDELIEEAESLYRQFQES